MDNGDNINLQACEIHCISNVVKLFLRELPEPVFPHTVYERMIKIAKSMNKSDMQTEIISSSLSHHAAIDPLLMILSELPKYHFELAKRVFKLLNKISQYSGENRMNSTNLGVCMGPNLLRVKVDNPTATLKDTPFIVKITDLMIQEYTMLFENKMNIHTKMRQRSVVARAPSAVFDAEKQQLIANAAIPVAQPAPAQQVLASDKQETQQSMAELKASNRKRAMLTIKGDYFATKEPSEAELVNSIKSLQTSGKLTSLDALSTSNTIENSTTNSPVSSEPSTPTIPAVSIPEEPVQQVEQQLPPQEQPQVVEFQLEQPIHQETTPTIYQMDESNMSDNADTTTVSEEDILKRIAALEADFQKTSE